MYQYTTMSGSGNQPNQGGGQSPQQGGQPQGQRGGQPQGGQPQGGQPQGGQPQGQPQGGYGQPPQGGNSPLDQLQQPGPMRFLKGSSVLGAVGGLVFAVMMVLISKIGGFPVLPGATSTIRSQMTGGATGGAGGGAAAAGQTQAFDATISTAHQTIIAYMSTELAPFLAFGLAVLVGVLVVTQLDDDSQTKMVAAGAGMFAGGALLVIVSSIVIGILGPSVPQVLLQQSGAGAFASAFNTSLASPQFMNIILNGIFAGLGAGATAVVTVFSLNNFFMG